jgi:cob(I)alamin adenosyltransferase
MIIVYTGNGKGKTTAALGLALRSIGYGKRVVLIQFMKGRETGEILAAKKILGLEIYQFGRKDFVDPKNPKKEDLDLASKGLEFAKKTAKKKPDILILDEINVAVKFGLLKLEDVLKLIGATPKNTTLVLTGRYAPKEIIRKADIVTEMAEIKHHFKKSAKAIKGIDY